MPQPLPPQRVKRKPAKPALAGSLLAVATLAAAISASPQTARAIVVPEMHSSASASPAPNQNALPLDSSLFLVLDDTISSRGQAGTTARAHLRDPIVVGGITVAPKNAPVQITVVHTQGAQMGNVDGSVDIYIEPLALANGSSLPLVTPTAHIDPHISAGQASTREISDTVQDIFIPYHYLYHMLRKGMEVNLHPGTVIRARTGAELRAVRGAVAIVTPPPLQGGVGTPTAPFKPATVATPAGFSTPAPKPSASVQPKPQTT
ncbi:MAG TPA: hypothetical protein VGR69_05235 [Candidatus Rubrimentiphilum sp.]|nr:hypothetical protein [Candidatus Rubrimentiphilum sp.]